MTTYDRADWHLQAARDRGQPDEHAFTHIGLYLAWLIRNDLVDMAGIDDALVADVASGERTGSELREAVGDQLSSDAMTPEGADFTAWYYPRYLDDFAAAFAEAPAYGVADDGDAYARIAPTIDRRYAEWLAAAWGVEPAALTLSADELRAMTPADLEALAQEFADAIGGDDDAVDSFGEEGVDVEAVGKGNGSPHGAPDLEAIMPREIAGTPLQISSARASEWQSSLLRLAVERVGVDPADAYVALGMGGSGEDALAITLYAIPGVPQDELEAEFSRDAYLAADQHWERRNVDGKVVWWAAGREFDTAFYALGGLVVTAGGAPERVRAAIELLP
jgi:hypothetical protein